MTTPSRIPGCFMRSHFKGKRLLPGLSDAQVFSIAFAYASFVLLARTHRVSVNVILFYRVRLSRTSRTLRISHFPRIAYGVSPSGKKEDIFFTIICTICFLPDGISHIAKGNYAVFVLFH